MVSSANDESRVPPEQQPRCPPPETSAAVSRARAAPRRGWAGRRWAARPGTGAGRRPGLQGWDSGGGGPSPGFSDRLSRDRGVNWDATDEETQRHTLLPEASWPWATRRGTAAGRSGPRTESPRGRKCRSRGRSPPWHPPLARGPCSWAFQPGRRSRSVSSRQPGASPAQSR